MQNVNDFEEFKALTIPKGKTVVFQLLNIKKDPDNAGRSIIPMTFLRPKDTIFINGKIREIAVVINQDMENPMYDQEIIFSPGNDGKISLRSGNPTDEKRYPYMMLCNYNLSNENRNIDIEPIFKVLDVEAEANAKYDEMDREEKVIGLINSLNLEQLGLLVGVLNMSTDNLDEKAVRFSLKQMAKSDSAAMLNAINAASHKEKDGILPSASEELAALNKSLQKRTMRNNKETKEVTYKDELIYTYTTEVWDKEAFISFLKAEKPEILIEITA